MGDLYAYLWHDGVLSVLINRPGRTTLHARWLRHQRHDTNFGRYRHYGSAHGPRER